MELGASTITHTDALLKTNSLSRDGNYRLIVEFFQMSLKSENYSNSDDTIFLKK